MRTVRHLLEAKNPEVFAIGPDVPVIDAVRLMAEKGIGAVLVMQGGRLAGILSERDYARKVVLQGRASSNTLVRDIRSEEHTSELQSLMRLSYAVFCLKKQKKSHT